MRLAKILIALFVAAIPSGIALADEPYLFNLLKEKPYRAAWTLMFKGETNVPSWVLTFAKTYDGVSAPSKAVEVDGQSDLVAWVCKPHDCGGNELYVLFAPGGAEAWGMLLEGEGNPRWLGKPSDAVKAVLTKAPTQQ
jgi:Inhibitor of vertebrate lysozyme (Ivy)